jgi:hypothetical protein
MRYHLQMITSLDGNVITSGREERYFMKNLFLFAGMAVLMLLMGGCAAKTRTMDVKEKIDQSVIPNKELKIQVGDISVEAVSLGAWWIVYYAAAPVKAYSKIARNNAAEEMVRNELGNNHKNFTVVDENPDYILDMEFETLDDNDYNFLALVTVKDGRSLDTVFQKEYKAYPTFQNEDSDKLLRSAFSNAIQQFIYDKEALVALNRFGDGTYTPPVVAKHDNTEQNINQQYDDDLENLLEKYPAAAGDRSKWLFVVGIGKYGYTDNITFARHSAEMFVKIMQKTQGVPPENSYIMLDEKASQARIKTNIKKMLRRLKPGDTIYFYYNGHGIPVPSQHNMPYLLAYDTEPDFVTDDAFFSLQNIYAKLSDSVAGKVVAVVDSCFSGVTDGKAVNKGVAATRVIPKRTSFNQEKMVVMSAGKGNQYSNAYDKKGHRLFSYFVMKNILEGKSDIKLLYMSTRQLLCGVRTGPKRSRGQTGSACRHCRPDRRYGRQQA